jgi:enterochelin esterase-like enzyme
MMAPTKTITTAGLILGLWAAAGSAQQVASAPASPEVHPDRRVTFRLLAPKAVEVKLSGEFMSGEKMLDKDAKGLWSVTVGPLEPEIYNYNLIVDGVVNIDPGNPNVKLASNPNTMGSVVEVPGASPAFYDGQATPHGAVQMRWYRSKSIEALRRVLVYTPPDYESGKPARYPVLYLLHGANGDETVWTILGHANLIVDNLLASGQAAPFIMVMPYGYGVPAGKLPRSGGDAAQTSARFTQDLLTDIIPFVQSQYRVYTDRDHRAIAGLSMGGGQALTIGLGHPELFSQVAGFSAALRAADFGKTFASTVANPQETNKTLRLLWFACGKQDSLFAPNQGFDAFLKERQIAHTFRPSEGAHTWINWRQYLNEVAPLLFR